MDNEERPVLEFEGFTRMMVSGANTKSELGDQGITEPEELTIPVSVKRFDLVTFNVADLRNQIRNGSVPLRIKGNSYDSELKRMEFDIQSVDNGIYSYKGTLKGVNDSKILLTISSRVVIAEVTIGDGSIWVKPVEPRRRAKEGKPGLHIVYSSRDTRLPTRYAKIDNGPVRLPNQTSTVVTIHELGHNFDADHEDAGGYNQAYRWWRGYCHHTVMWSGYTVSGSEYEFSSDDYHGDSTHDDARRISETKGVVASVMSTLNCRIESR